MKALLLVVIVSTSMACDGGRLWRERLKAIEEPRSFPVLTDHKRPAKSVPDDGSTIVLIAIAMVALVVMRKYE